MKTNRLNYTKKLWDYSNYRHRKTHNYHSDSNPTFVYAKCPAFSHLMIFDLAIDISVLNRAIFTQTAKISVLNFRAILCIFSLFEESTSILSRGDHRSGGCAILELFFCSHNQVARYVVAGCSCCTIKFKCSAPQSDCV